MSAPRLQPVVTEGAATALDDSTTCTLARRSPDGATRCDGRALESVRDRPGTGTRGDDLVEGLQESPRPSNAIVWALGDEALVAQRVLRQRMSGSRACTP
jgi:hypothetical protein